MEWFADESFWTTFGQYIYSDARLQRASDDVDRLLALAAARPSDVLDLGCGTGRHAVEFSRRGCTVTGVDRTKPVLAQARAYAAETRVDVEFVECDMREFVRTAAFDLVVSFFTSFGYFRSVEDERRVVANVFQSLRPGGTFIVDVMGKEVLARIFQATRSDVAPDGTLIIWRTAVDDGWSRIKGQWYAVRDRDVRCFQVDHWIYSGRELRDLLMGTGFREVSLYGDLEGQEYGPTATRLVAVGRKGR